MERPVARTIQARGTVAMSFNFDLQQVRIGIMGLGYVGLPLAVAFGKRYPTLGFDVGPASPSCGRVGAARSKWSRRSYEPPSA